MFRLNNVLRVKYRFKKLGDDFDYCNLDEVYIGGRNKFQNPEKYHITYSVVPEGRKRHIGFILKFGEYGEYLGYYTYTKYKKKWIEKWERDALEWLLKNGYLWREDI